MWRANAVDEENAGNTENAQFEDTDYVENNFWRSKTVAETELEVDELLKELDDNGKK